MPENEPHNELNELSSIAVVAVTANFIELIEISSDILCLLGGSDSPHQSATLRFASGILGNAAPDMNSGSLCRPSGMINQELCEE